MIFRRLLVCVVSTMRRRVVQREWLPERLARFRESEWRGKNFTDRLRQWREKRTAYIADQGWLRTNPGLWIDATRGTVSEVQRARREKDS